MLAESCKMGARHLVLPWPMTDQLATFTLQGRRCSGNTQDRAGIGSTTLWETMPSHRRDRQSHHNVQNVSVATHFAARAARCTCVPVRPAGQRKAAWRSRRLGAMTFEASWHASLLSLGRKRNTLSASSDRSVMQANKERRATASDTGCAQVPRSLGKGQVPQIKVALILTRALSATGSDCCRVASAAC